MVRLRFLPPLAAYLAATVGCVGPFTLSKSESGLSPSPVSPVTSPNPLAQLERSLVFEAANEPKQFLPLPDRDHNDPQPDSYYLALSQFLARLP